MKGRMLLLVAGGSLFLAGCASSPQRTDLVAQNDIDHQKIYLVEQWAKRNGASVFWVNYPQKPASPAQ